MTVTKLYKKFSTSWPHEHPGLSFLLTFIAISQKQEQGQVVETAEELSRLWYAPLHGDSSALPVLGLPWERYLSMLPKLPPRSTDQLWCTGQPQDGETYSFLNLQFLHTVPQSTGGTQKWYCGFMSRIYHCMHTSQGLELQVLSNM